MKIRTLLLGGAALAALAVYLLWSGGPPASPPPREGRAAPARAAQPAPARLAGSEVAGGQVVDEIGRFVDDWRAVVAGGDREAIRGFLSGGDLLEAARADDPLAGAPLEGIEHVPLPVTPETIRDLEDSILDILLGVPEEERNDWALRARLRDVIALGEGRYFVRVHGEGVLRAPPTGRATGVEPRQYGPDDRIRADKEERMVVARRGDGWKVVEFPPLHRHPPLADRVSSW